MLVFDILPTDAAPGCPLVLPLVHDSHVASRRERRVVPRSVVSVLLGQSPDLNKAMIKIMSKMKTDQKTNLFSQHLLLDRLPVEIELVHSGFVDLLLGRVNVLDHKPESRKYLENWLFLGDFWCFIHLVIGFRSYSSSLGS